MTDRGDYDIDRRVTRVETAFDQHVKYCVEQSRRTAENLYNIQASITQLREALDRGLARVHARIEKIVYAVWCFLTVTLLTVVGWLLANGRPWA